MTEDEIFPVRHGRVDDEEFARLAAEIETRLYRSALLLCGNREEAREILQDTLVALYLALPRFRRASSIYTFAWRIMANLNGKRVRALARARRRPVAPAENYRLHPGAGPAAALETIEKRETVRKAVARLPLRYREVIVLRYIEEMTPAQIARELGLKVNTVRTRLARGREKLRFLLGSPGPGRPGKSGK